MKFGQQICSSLDEGTRREWLLTDGLGGFAMGTVSGLRTRRYHGLLVTATTPPVGRMMGLVSLDAIVEVAGRTVRLATHEWSGGAVQPTGHVRLVSCSVGFATVRWLWSVDDVVIERTLTIAPGRNAIAVTHRVVSSLRTVRLELEALCTWRDIHGERRADGPPIVESGSDGFTFEHAFAVRADGFTPDGRWYHGVHHRMEADRGLTADEDVWCAGRFTTELDPGGAHETVAYAVVGHDMNPSFVDISAAEIIDASSARHAEILRVAGPADATAELLLLAADQFVVSGSASADIVAGYPWFGGWSRDTMTSLEGLLLETGRHAEGREVLNHAARNVSEGMLANTADAGSVEYNTVDAALWFIHAVDRYHTCTDDTDLLDGVLEPMTRIINGYRAGTRFGIRVDTDGLVTQGQEGWALTWMDARLPDGPVTPRRGKPVEVNALWINALAVVVTALADLRPTDPLLPELRELHESATNAFSRFVRPDGSGLFDTVDGPDGDDPSIRPNQLFAVSLPHGPLRNPLDARKVLDACAPLLTPLGLRTLHPDDPSYIGVHRGDVRARDHAYHQGTTWPWLIGPYVDACIVSGDQMRIDVAADSVRSLVGHLGDWGVGSISETADGDAPHTATGCPFQAWSVAEVLRARRALERHGSGSRNGTGPTGRI